MRVGLRVTEAVLREGDRPVAVRTVSKQHAVIGRHRLRAFYPPAPSEPEKQPPDRGVAAVAGIQA
jgi:hypothetical protein